MPADTLPDLVRIHVAEALFLECVIQAADLTKVGSSLRVSGFSVPEVLIDFSFDLTERRFDFIFHITCEGLNEADQPLGLTGSFKVHLGYLVENMAELLMLGPDGKHDIPNAALAHTLLGAGYSTVRGMLMSKTTDTLLEGLALPLRSVNDLFEETLARKAQQAAVPSRARRARPKKT